MRENFKTKFIFEYPKAFFFHNINGIHVGIKAGIVGSGRAVYTTLTPKAENIRLKSLNAFAI